MKQFLENDLKNVDDSREKSQISRKEILKQVQNDNIAVREISREDILKLCEKMKDDKPKLRNYLHAIFKKRENIALFGWFINKNYVKLATPKFHREILAMVSDDENKRLAFGAPRGHAKSTTVDFVFSLWSAVNEKHHFEIIISDTYSQSVEFINSLKDEFENNVILRWLYGNLASALWRDGEFVLKTDIKFVAMGAGQKIRGARFKQYRPDLIICDDLENDEQVGSAEQRKKLKRWFSRAVIPSLAKNGKIVIVGTILHFDSLLNNILAKNESFAAWKTRLYRAISIDENGEEIALWPEHMSLAKLHAIRDDPTDDEFVGSITFAQEYQNRPFDEADALIKPDWLNWVDENDAPSENSRRARVMTIDSAASEKDTSDPTARIVADLGADGNLYVRAIGNDRLRPLKAAESIRDWDEIYKPDRIGIESGVLGIVFGDLLAGLPITELKADKSKVRRLLSVVRFFEAGKIFVVRSAKNAQALYDQLLEFPAATHDDMVDALVYAIRLLLVNGVGKNEEAQTAGDYNGYLRKNSDEDDGFDDFDEDL